MSQSDDKADSFGDVKWPALWVVLLFVAYQIIWNLPHEGVLAKRIENVDPVTSREYMSLLLSCGIKFLIAAAALAIMIVSKTTMAEVGGSPRIAGAPKKSWILPLVWMALIASIVNTALHISAPIASSREGDPPITAALVLSTLLMRQLLNPASEEILFRGLIFLTLRRRWGAGWGIVLSTLIFAAIHYNGGTKQQTFALVMGTILVCFYERTRSLPQTYLLHSIINLSMLWVMLQRGHL